jgi:hypothetical protein
LLQATTAFIDAHRLNPARTADQHILALAGYPSHPIYIALDGGHQQHPNSTKTAASFVILQQPSTDTNKWNLMSIPIFGRFQQIPHHLGFTTATNAIAEEAAFVLALEALPIDACLIIINDSTSERSRHINLRDNNYSSPRTKIRKGYSGASKAYALRLEKQLQDHQQYLNTHSTPLATSHITACIVALTDQCSTNPLQPWPLKYIDTHPTRPVINVDSHQLHPNFTKANRYPDLAPNLLLVSANQWADNIASYAIQALKLNHATYHPDSTHAFTQTIRHPLGLRFHFSYNGHTIDNDISKTIWNISDAEYIGRAQRKARQGGAFRAQPWCQHACRLVPTQHARRRLFLGLAHSHTRSIYKDGNYRLAYIHLLEGRTV